MTIEKLKLELEQRINRLNEDFKDYPEIQEHGVPEIEWVLEMVNKIK
ncbi:hypothetical protein HN448_04390 [archaeon]|jgi:hypothetical protein|nr:hypothetical protein [archaeon]